MNLKNLYQNEYSFEEKINENFFKLESFSTLSIKEKTISSTSNDVIDDVLYLIDENDDELFKDKKNQVCCHNANIGWFFYTPKEGNIAYLQSEVKFIYYDGEQWKDFNINSGNNTVIAENGEIDISQFLLKNQNLNDLLNSQTARNNLNVYSKNEVYKKDEIDDKLQNLNVDIDTYTKSEIDNKIINIQSGGTDIDLSDYLNKNQNLSDLNNKVVARSNLSVYSKDEIDEKINNINQNTTTNTNNGSAKNLVGDYKMSAQKQDHDNWYICDGRELSRNEYPELFSVIGTDCGVGNGTTTFNLPDFRDKTMWGANGNLNQSLQSGLPNITGEISSLLGDNSVSEDVDGCLKSVNNTESVRKYGGGNGSAKIVSFDASKSNDIYGKSTIVQPPALCVNVFICVK